MPDLSSIDINRSISSGRLICKRHWMEAFDSIVFSMFCISMMAYPGLLIYGLDLAKPNDKAFAFTVLPLAILSGCYGLFRKWTERRLLKVETVRSRAKNKELLLGFLAQKGYSISRQSKELVIVTREEELSSDGLWTKTMTFIVDDRHIYFNIVKSYPTINPPVLFSHLFLKRELRKFTSR